jgi:four helix bundle protein
VDPDREANDVERDPLRKMRSWQLADELRRLAWDDAERLQRHPITGDVARQLYRAVGSIPANLAEGYSRSSGRDRARLFEYALGSARECIEWYLSALPVLGETVVAARHNVLVEIRRLLVATIPRERARTIRPESQRERTISQS